MNKKTTSILVAILVVLVGIAVFTYSQRTPVIVPAYDPDAVNKIVTDFGLELKNVSLLAPSDVLATSMDEHYGKYLTPELLSTWKNDPSVALGREVSSPYPDRIEIDSVTADNEQQYTVKGKVVEMTSDDIGKGTFTDKYDVTIGVQDQNGTLFINSVAKGDIQASSGNDATLAGVGACLPHRDTGGPITMECAFGLKTADGSFYALNLDSSSPSSPINFDTSGATHYSLQGTLQPANEVSGGIGATYDIKGIFTVKSFQEVR